MAADLVGPWPERECCPRCGSKARIEANAGRAYCGTCRLPDPTPAGWALPEHDDPEALI